MSDVRLTLDLMPLRGGLATAGKRSTIDEHQLWAAQNMYPDLDGALRTRPGTLQHGQRIMLPDADQVTDYSYNELLADLSSWDVTETASDATYAVSNGLLTISQSEGVVEFEHADTVASLTSTNCTIRFSARVTNPEGAETTGGQLRVQWNAANGVAGNARQAVINATGVGTLVSSAYTHPSGEDDLDLDLGGFHVYELRYNGTDEDVEVYVDDVYKYTLDVSTADVPLALTSSLRFYMSSGTEVWSANISDVMFSDTDADAFEGQPLVDVGRYERRLTGGAIERSLLAATTSNLYVDIGDRGVWRPILAVASGHTRFLPYRDRLLVFDDNGQNNTKVYAWNGVELPEQVVDAPPVRFGSEHRSRVFASGDRNYPLRVYFTASRQYDVWFAPAYDSDETFEEVTQAGYIDVPSETGDEVTGLYGEFYGNLIIVTKRGIWRLAGSSPDSFRMENVTKKVGGESPDGMVQIGNDLYVVGRQGVVSVATSQNYGDLQTAMPSGAIANIWSSLPDVADRVDREQLTDSYFDVLPSLNMAVLGMRGQGESALNLVYAYSPLNQTWFGPWTYEPTCFKAIEFGTPTLELLISGTSDGYVVVTGLGTYTDRGTAYTSRVETPMYSGRSLGAELTHQEKRWRTLRLFLLARGLWPFTLQWRTDNRDFQTATRYQLDNVPVLNDGLRTNVDVLGDAEEVVLIEETLDDNGRYIHFVLESDYEIVLQGMQVEFIPGDDPEG